VNLFSIYQGIKFEFEFGRVTIPQLAVGGDCKLLISC